VTECFVRFQFVVFGDNCWVVLAGRGDDETWSEGGRKRFFVMVGAMAGDVDVVWWRRVKIAVLVLKVII